MILLIHSESKTVTQVMYKGEEISHKYTSCTKTFWELAKKFPEEIIGWVESRHFDKLNLQYWDEIFHHDLVMASYSLDSQFLPAGLGYIDQLPFLNVNRKVLYGTWKMSADMGGIKGKVLLKFRSLMGEINNFEYLINSIAKLGQQNSLFCYSAPSLCVEGKKEQRKIIVTSSEEQLFSFVYQHYNTSWMPVLLWSLWKYENKFPLISFLKALGSKKIFRQKIDLSVFPVASRKEWRGSNEIDVIIPTIGRPEYLLKVLEDFAAQRYLPQLVIIVEQNPDINSVSQLKYLNQKKWPFTIKHLLIHQTGACNARNIAISHTQSDWIFFSDDDQRFEPDLIEKVFAELEKYGVDGLTTSYLQINEERVFQVPKQWGTFGAGNSIVRKKFVEKVKFSSAFEYGYGEDVDYGMQLRNEGCDIIYHPGLVIKHLKAPVGGFRQKTEIEWEREEPEPKPSPTLMALAKRHYTPEQIKGFKISLFLRFYDKQPIKNPYRYLKVMEERWKRSNRWADKLLQKK